MGEKYTKPLKYSRVCKYCSVEFMAADVKANSCVTCRSPRLCKCGCGGFVKSRHAEFVAGHKNKGKSYLEIYGTSTPKCGFRTGDENPNYDTILKAKSNESLKQYYKNNPDALYDKIRKTNNTKSSIVHSSGEKFNSGWEVTVYDVLTKHQILFTREVKVPLRESGIKIVDFVVDGNIYIEVVGMSYNRDIATFTTKMTKLYNTVIEDGHILIISNDQNRPKIAEFAHMNDGIITCTLAEKQIVRAIRMLQILNKQHEIITQIGKTYELDNR